MVIAEFNVIAGFQYYNYKYFNSILPFPTIVIRHSYRTLGYFHCELDYNGNIMNPIIEMSDNYNYTKEQFRDILVHEMIHYYLLYTKRDMKCKHGKEFKKMANDFNLRYGWNITPIIDLSGYTIKKGNSNFMFKLCTFF